MTARKGTKKRHAKLLFCYYKPIAFVLFSLLLPSSLLKFPNGLRTTGTKKYSIYYLLQNKQTILQFPFNTHLLQPKPYAVLHKSHWYSFSTIKKKKQCKNLE